MAKNEVLLFFGCSVRQSKPMIMLLTPAGGVIEHRARVR